MRRIVLFEDAGFEGLLPLVYWRSVFELRVGRRIQLDRIAQALNTPIAGVWTRDWIAEVAAQRCGAPANAPLNGPAVLVNGRWLCSDATTSRRVGCELPQEPCAGRTADGGLAYLVCDERLAASISPGDSLVPEKIAELVEGLPVRDVPGRLFSYPWELVAELPDRLRSQWRPEDAGVRSELDPGLHFDHGNRVRIGERVRIHRTVVLDASEGPIFIGDDVSIGPYAVIEGPASIGPGSHVNPHAWLHGGNAVGPVCKVGGELCGSIVCGYTNKQHHGFLGHAYVGCWVNLGAGATNSNLKNTYGTVRVPLPGGEVESGLRFFGSVIADHAKIGINAAIPTGAVIGFAASIAASGLVPKYVPSFGWVRGESVQTGDHRLALDVAAAVTARRNVELTDAEVELFLALGDHVRRFESKPS